MKRNMRVMWNPNLQNGGRRRDAAGGIWVLAIAAVAAGAMGACSKSHSARSDAPGTDAQSADAAVAVFDVPVSALQGGGAISGAQVCVVGTAATGPEAPTDCVQSNDLGSATLSLAVTPGSSTYFALQASGVADYYDAVSLWSSLVGSQGQRSTAGTDLQMWSTTYATTVLGTQAGFDLSDATTGYVMVRLMNGSGATATISPTTTKGAVYSDGSGNFDPTLTSAGGSDGTILFGNVTPGSLTITVTSAGQTCTDSASTLGALAGDWPPTGNASVDGIAVANAITEPETVICP